MSVTSIEWTSRTWNPVRGCSRVSEGCVHCYAETFAARNLPEMRSPTTGKPFAVRTAAGPRWTGKVELIPSKLDEPLRWRKPQRIFVNSMSDLFHESLSNEEIEKVFAVMALAPRHTFQVLTKRPARMREWFASGVPGLETREEAVQRAAEWRGKVIFDSRGAERHRYPPNAGDVSNRRPWPGWPLPNVWLGDSVEDQATADVRIPLLLQTPAAVRFISLEPQLEHVDLRPYVALLDVLCCPLCGFRTNREGHGPCPNDGATLGPDVRLDWVIVGGESGPGARPFDVAWARSTVDACKAAGVPVFVKQLGAKPIDTARIEAEPDLPGDKVLDGQEATPAQLDRLAYLLEVGTVRLKDRKGGDMSEWEEGLRVREFPR